MHGAFLSIYASRKRFYKDGLACPEEYATMVNLNRVDSVDIHHGKKPGNLRPTRYEYAISSAGHHSMKLDLEDRLDLSTASVFSESIPHREYPTINLNYGKYYTNGKAQLPYFAVDDLIAFKGINKYMRTPYGQGEKVYKELENIVEGYNGTH